ncbi:hypothetical protein L0F63_000991 [Massospora cicadina]|nr:hypothetical protein L0F63_000991 [Massospora cicadina]
MSPSIGPPTKESMLPSDLRISKFRLEPEKPFDLEDFCKDIPISVLDFGIRLVPEPSVGQLAADKSYIDISFRDQDEAKAAAQKEFVFQERALKPITTLCYKKQLAFVILKDFTNQPTLEEVEKRVFEKIYTIGTPIKVAFLEISNTQFLAPLVAAIIAISGKSCRSRFSLRALRLIEYCSACNKLGHIYCNFNPPKAEGGIEPEPPANGHGAGDLKAAPLTALSSRGTSIPLTHYDEGVARSNSKPSASQMLSFKDILQDSLEPTESSQTSAAPLNGVKKLYTAEEYNELKAKFDNLYSSYTKLLPPSIQTALVANHPSQLKKSQGPLKEPVPPPTLPSSSTGTVRKRGRPRKDASADEYSTHVIKPVAKPMSQAQNFQALAITSGFIEGQVRGPESLSTIHPAGVTLNPGSASALTSAAASVPFAIPSDFPRKRGRPRKVRFNPASDAIPQVSPRTRKAPNKDEAQGQSSTQAPGASESVDVSSSQPLVTPNSGASFAPVRRLSNPQVPPQSLLWLSFHLPPHSLTHRTVCHPLRPWIPSKLQALRRILLRPHCFHTTEWDSFNFKPHSRSNFGLLIGSLGSAPRTNFQLAKP